MTGTITTREPYHDQEDAYWGGCPDCRKTDGYINIGPGHWFYCSEHKTRWFVGSNLFSAWRDETEDEQRQQWDELDFGTYEVLDPDGSYLAIAKRRQ